ncbi:MAG: aspartyl/asparaginyl beta-hydroxylase domain-containing protein, partial [Salibacteraceae bacterium]
MTTRKILRRAFKRAIVLGPIAYFYWPVVAVFFVTGTYDVLRHHTKDKALIFRQYFFESGTLTWLFSPLNTLIDILSLPFINKQIYKLEDLPKKHQADIQTILDEVPKKQLNETLEKLEADTERSMLFYKWYGYNVDNSYPVPLFHRKFKTIKTIGISSFNPHASTSQHFGWLRAGIRVLINIDEDVQGEAYLEVNGQTHSWKDDGPLFIFDDTVLHQSFNKSGKRRSNLFIDIARPTPFPFVMDFIFWLFGLISTSFKAFRNLSNWKV